MKIAAAYIRVSTDDQIEFSPDSQLKKIREYAKSNDFILSDEFIFRDEGISGRTAEKRPEFQRMIALAKKKQFDAIIVWKFSRFARNREDSIVYKSLLRKHGVDVLSVSEQLSDDNSSILMEAIYEAMDEYYSANLSQEVKRGMAEKFSRGGITAPPPIGYKSENGTYIPDEQADIVRKIFEDFADGKPYRVIASELNNLGIRTKKGRLFENRAVEYILSNPCYIGKLRRSKPNTKQDHFHDTADVVDGHFEHIIDDDLFNKVQERRRSIKQLFPKFAKTEDAGFMLKGLVRCSCCGSTLTRSNKGLQCNAYSKGTCKTSHYISISKINKAVLDAITMDLKTDNFNITIQPPNKPNTTQNDLVYNLIAKEENKLKRIKDAYLNGIDSIEEYKANKQQITKTIEELKKQIISEPVENVDIKKAVKESLKILDSNNKENDKNLALRKIIDKIVFDRPNCAVKIIYNYYI